MLVITKDFGIAKSMPWITIALCFRGMTDCKAMASVHIQELSESW